MAKVQCYNCKKVTPVIAPKYRCKFCNYPLNKYLEQEEEPEEEIIIEKIKQEEPEEPTIHDIYRDNQFDDNTGYEEEEPEEPKFDLQEILDKLKSDEKVEHSVTGPVIIKQNLNPEKSGKVVAGWLVVHTENKIPVTYELYEGNNVIGRPDGPHHVDIRIEEDEYVSRAHAFIRITKDFMHRFHYELVDDGSMRGGSPSTNGCFVNGVPDRLPSDKVVFLRDGDTIQVGITKLVFKNTDESDDLGSAAYSVIGTGFTNTVAIR